MPLILPPAPRITRAGREYPRELPLRSDPRWGLHVVQPARGGLPVGDGQPSDIDPTASWPDYPVILRPPLPHPPEQPSESQDCCDDTAAAQYQVTISGVTGTCCTIANRTWTMSRVNIASPCEWRQTITFASCGTPPNDNSGMFCSFRKSGTNMTLSIVIGPGGWPGGGGFGGIVYTIAYATWDCEASVVMPRTTNISCGGSWPATATVSPV